MTRLTLAGALGAAAAVLALGAEARADQVQGSRSEQLIETDHQASLTIAPGYATLRVRRTVHNGGPRHDQALFFIDVPAGGVAVGLRTLGLLDGRPTWFDGELMEAEAAAAKYRELTGLGGYYPKDPALLSWRSQERLALQVFPVAPQGPKTVEYTYLLPTQYRGGRHHVSLPAMGTETLKASLRARAAEPGASLYLGERRQAPNAQIALETAAEVDVAVAPRRPTTLAGALAVMPFADGRVLTRFRVEAAPTLSQAPKRARVVVLIDTSRSLDDDEVEAQRLAAQAYLAHMPDARVSVLTFDRKVRALHDSFVPSARAQSDLEKASLPRANGSQVDDALVEAERRLAREPGNGAKRILLLTDSRTREALDAQGIDGSLGPSGALVHVGMVRTGAPDLLRDDDHGWSAAVRRTGGLVWHASVDSGGDVAMRRELFEEWARPLRIDHLTLSAPRLDATALWVDPSLSEGEGVSHVWIDEQQAPWLKVDGELWATPIQHWLHPDDAEAERWSALVFGDPLMSELSDEEMMTLALRGRAVSPVTSYLAIEPGVRPSTEGLEEGEGWGFGSGSGRLGGSHRAHAPRMSVDSEAFLRDALGRAWTSCGGSGSVTVELESTLAEVVEVGSVSSAGGSQTSAIACLVEATWALLLPASFDAEHARWRIAL